MTTEQIIWFIDCRFYYQTTSLDKLVHLVPPHHKTLKIILDARGQYQGRGYWHLLIDNNTLSAELMATINAKKHS
ncbi:hypothetical protein E2R68_08230 [Psychromonas sp. RZ22]|uniref:hypothetical protein n=1 Tax=Psychromonas algarum TaxID=2555643 RepID=UPI0010686384|nr:hypothetical protein [Psychromonas sp. RZ22]TEW54676.1 hypothetical protein E2R68_08230 [Psychromonas sp. RZ22]